MPYLIYTLMLLLLVFFPREGTGQQWPDPSERLHSDYQTIPVYEGFDRFAPVLSPAADTLHVVNFWATWCAPCVQELPYFDELAARADSLPLRVTLVSLDFRKQLTTRLLPFLNKHKLRPQVVVLDDVDANSWIDRIDPSWSGAIPATLFLADGIKVFREGSFTRTDLHALVDSLMKEIP